MLLFDDKQKLGPRSLSGESKRNGQYMSISLGYILCQ
jgi:hypothetical protein